MPTPNRMKSANRNARAFTLVEVMVSTIIFSFVSLSLSGLFLQNQRFAREQTYNVQLINSSFGILDQLKNLGSTVIFQAYQKGLLSQTPNTFAVRYVDPTDLTDGYRVADLAVNQADTVTANTIPTTINLKFGTQSGSSTIPVNYWLTLRRNLMLTGNHVNCDVIEATLVYQWKVPGRSNVQSGQLQITFPAPNGRFQE